MIKETVMQHRQFVKVVIAIVAFGLCRPAFAVFDSTLGRWITRDPQKYVDGTSLVQYVQGNPVRNNDAAGKCGSSSCSGTLDLGASHPTPGSIFSDGSSEVIIAGCSGYITTLCWQDEHHWGPMLQQLRSQISQACGFIPPVRCVSSCLYPAWTAPDCVDHTINAYICDHGPEA